MFVALAIAALLSAQSIGGTVAAVAGEGAPGCCGCKCAEKSCCVSSGSKQTPLQPPASVPASPKNSDALPAPVMACGKAEQPVPAIVISSLSSSLSDAGQPLFVRYCALLI